MRIFAALCVLMLIAQTGEAFAQNRTPAELEADAAVELARVRTLHNENRLKDELVAARRLLDLREQIEILHKAEVESVSDVTQYISHLSWRRAVNLLGSALYRNGTVGEAEPLYTRLATDLLAQRAKNSSRSSDKLDPLAEEDILAAQVLSGDEAGTEAEQAFIREQVPIHERVKRNADYYLMETSYIDALVLRAGGLLRAGRIDAAVAAYERAVATSSTINGKQDISTTVISNTFIGALEDCGKDLEMKGDRQGASLLFHRAADLAAFVYPPDDVHITVERNLVRFGDQLRDKDPTLTLRNVELVFPGVTDVISRDDLKELNALTGLPTDDSLRSDRHLSNNQQIYAIYAKWLGDDHPLTIQYLAFLANDWSQDGQPAKAVEFETRFVERASRLLGETNVQVVNERVPLGMALDASGRPSEAIEQLTIVAHASASRVAAGDNAAMIPTWALHNLLVSQGRTVEALPYMQALTTAVLHVSTKGSKIVTNDVQNQLEPDFALDRMALELAGDFRELGRFAEAERWDSIAFDLRTKELGRDAPDTTISAARLAADILGQGARDAEAYALISPSYKIEATLSRKIWAEYEIAGFIQFQSAREFASQARPTYLNAAFSLYKAKAVVATEPEFLESVFGALQDSFDSTTALAVAHNAARRYAISIGAGDLVTRREALAGQATAALGALDRAEGPRGTASDESRADSAINASDQAFKVLAAELRARAPRYQQIVGQPPLTTTGARQLMQPNEAALIVVPTDGGTHLVAVTREAITWTRSPLTADQLSAKVARLRRDLDPTGPPNGAFDRKTAHELYLALVEPLKPALLGKTTLYVVPGGALARLPLAVLVTEPPTAGSDDADPDELRRTPWLADTFALVQIPSLQSLAYEREFNERPNVSRKPLAGASDFAGYGDPAFSATEPVGKSRRGAFPVIDAAQLIESNSAQDQATGSAEPPTALMDPKLLQKLPRLPGTRVELETMRAMLGAPEGALHMGEEMREGPLRKADLSHVRVLHIATHGLTASESGSHGEPGLVFTPPATATPEDDGYLSASEVASLDLSSAEWVILSACNTAAPEGAKDNSGLSGLARAFMLAGTQSLLVSHWPVDDEVAARMTVDILRRAQIPGTSRAQALQQAMRAVREDQSDPFFAHPNAWAPFALVGEGG